MGLVTILTDHQIRDNAKALGIEPFNPAQVQPASYDLTLDRYFRRFPSTPSRLPVAIGGNQRAHKPIDPRDPEDRTIPVECGEGERVLLEPQAFLLASTVERVSLPDNIVAQVEGKSSLARLGLFVHVTAGWIDPGFSGHITLELFCANPYGIWLYPDMPVAQIAFTQMTKPAANPYGRGATGSKYADQPRGPVVSRYWRNFDTSAEIENGSHISSTL